MKERKTLSAGRVLPPPGKSLQAGSIAIPAAMAKSSPKVESAVGPGFRIFGGVLLVLGLICLGIGIMEGHVIAILSGVSSIFWSALMFAIAEVLHRLAEISTAVRKQADRVQ